MWISVDSIHLLPTVAAFKVSDNQQQIDKVGVIGIENESDIRRDKPR